MSVQKTSERGGTKCSSTQQRNIHKRDERFFFRFFDEFLFSFYSVFLVLGKRKKSRVPQILIKLIEVQS